MRRSPSGTIGKIASRTAQRTAYPGGLPAVAQSGCLNLILMTWPFNLRSTNLKLGLLWLDLKMVNY